MTKSAEPDGVARAALEAKRGFCRAERAYAVADVEMRAVGEPDSTKVQFTGHASVTGKGYDMYGGPDKGGWTEYVDQGAFKRTLSTKPDVAFLLNHAGLTLARTKAGTLSLAEDSVGLSVDATLDTRVSAVNDMVVLMEDGNLDEMSFAFRVAGQTWLDAEGDEVPWWDLSGVERHITEVNIQKGDVSVVNYGANPFTDAALRSLDDAVRALIADRPTMDEGELRRALAVLTDLLPQRDLTPMPHDFIDENGNGVCDVCLMPEDQHPNTEMMGLADDLTVTRLMAERSKRRQLIQI